MDTYFHIITALFYFEIHPFNNISSVLCVQMKLGMLFSTCQVPPIEFIFVFMARSRLFPLWLLIVLILFCSIWLAKILRLLANDCMHGLSIKFRHALYLS